MAKNNIRSVRFSDEMIEIINQQVGENFTQKFERMVYNCYISAGCRDSGEAEGDALRSPPKGAIRPDRPHPLFYGFVKAVLWHSR